MRGRAAGRKLAVAAAVVLAAGAGAVGCGGDDAAAPGARTTTTAPAPPAGADGGGEIDEAYVERVLTRLYEIDGDAVRQAVKDGFVDEAVMALFDAIYGAELAGLYINDLAELAAGGFEGFHRPPGDVKVRSARPLQADAGCMYVEAILDSRQMSIEAVEPSPVRIHLSPSPPAGPNETGWRIEAFSRPDSTEAGPCT